MDLCFVSWLFDIIINYLRPSCTVRGTVNVKAKKKGLLGLPDFLVTGGDILLDPFGLEHQSLMWRVFFSYFNLCNGC